MSVLGELHFNRLLVAVDGSPQADLALSAAITAARRMNTALTLVCVAPDAAQEAASRWPAGAPLGARSQEAADAEAERTLREAVDRIPADLPVERLVLRGKPGPQIVRHAGCGRYDAIVLGARGVGRVGSLVGSVSQYVLHHADIPVIVAHAPKNWTGPDAP